MDPPEDQRLHLRDLTPEMYEDNMRQLTAKAVARRRAEREARAEYGAPGTYRVRIFTDDTSWRPTRRTIAQLFTALSSEVDVQYPLVIVGDDDDTPGSLQVNLWLYAEEYEQAELRALSAVRDALESVGALSEADWPSLLYAGVEAHPDDPHDGDRGAEFRRMSSEQSAWAGYVLRMSRANDVI